MKIRLSQTFLAVRAALQLGGGLRGAISGGLAVFKREGISGVVKVLVDLSYYRPQPSRGVSDSFSQHLTWVQPLLNEVIIIDPRVGLVPPQRRRGIPVLKPERSIIGHALSGVFETLNDVRVTDVIWLHSRTMGGATDFALKIADSISRQSKNRTVLIVETGPPRQSRVKLSKVDSNTYVLNPLTSRNYRAVSPELKFWLELSVQLGAKSHTGISSKIFFDLLTLYGQALRLTSRTGALFFCPDYDVSGYDIGHSVSYFAQIADTLDYILTDNQSHIPELIQKYGLPDSISDKVHFLYYPLSSESNPVVAEPLDNERLKILWAGRFSKQKGVSELVQIAATLRDLDFLVFGGTKSQFPIRPIPKNMKILGAFEGIDSLSKHKAHLYLNTSHWDGRPITMLQFLARKTPVLSSSSGGLKEMLVGPDSTAIIVDDSTDVSEYVARLTEIETNRQRLSNLSAATNLRLISQHSKDGFDSVLNQALNLSSH